MVECAALTTVLNGLQTRAYIQSHDSMPSIRYTGMLYPQHLYSLSNRTIIIPIYLGPNGLGPPICLLPPKLIPPSLF